MGSRARRPNTVADEVAAAFQHVRSDRVRGAQALALDALRTLQRLLARWSRRSALPSPRGLAGAVARVLEQTQPAMGPFARWAREWRRMARAHARGTWLRRAHVWVRRELHRIRAENSGLGRTCRRRFPVAARHVVTISRSRSVLEALRALPRPLRPSHISVLESLPGGEGRMFARDLRKAGFSARTIPDRDGVDAVRSADLLVLGADAVAADGSVVHKVGTRVLAEAAARSGTRVVVIAGRSKFTGRPAPRNHLPPGFDRTPARWISEYWTDAGPQPGRRTLPRGTRPPSH